MQHYLRRSIGLAVLGSLLAACDTVRDERVAIDDVPPANIVRLPGAENVRLTVVAVDKRAGLRDRISSKRGIASAVVYPANDIIEVVRKAVESGFTAQGFAIGTGGFTVTVEVLNFYNNFRPSPWFVGSMADVSVTLKVRNASGALAYTHTYDGVAQLGAAFNESAETAKLALQQALASVVSQIAEDKALQALLIAKAGSPARGRAS